MLGSQILDVALGVILVFLLISLIASAVREAIEAQMKSRAVYLERGILELLDAKGESEWTTKFYEHPLIYSLYPGGYEAKSSRRTGGRLPTYIPAKNFAEAIIDLTIRGTTEDAASSRSASPATVDAVRQNVSTLPPKLARAVLIAADHAENDLSKVTKNLQDWFDSSMDRVSGRYKRNTHRWLFGIGFVMAAAFNINALRIADGLWRDKPLRESLVKRAEAAAQSPEYQRNLTDSAARAADLKNTLADLRVLTLPIGWSDSAKREFMTRSSSGAGLIWFLVVALIGYLLTAVAITLGAPFWFDLLGKVIVLRSTVKPHEKSPEEASKDRSAAGDKPAPSTPTGSQQPSRPAPAPSPFAEIITAGAALAAASAVTDGADQHEWASEDDPDEGII